jgi:hypothetical protein
MAGGLYGPADAVAKVGLVHLSRTIRRCVALWAAVVTAPEDSTDDAVMQRADNFSAHLLKGEEDAKPTPQPGDPGFAPMPYSEPPR